MKRSQYLHQQKRKAYYIPLCCEGKITEKECAKKLGMSEYGVTLLKRRYRKKGGLAFVNGHKNQVPANKKYVHSFCEHIVKIYYNDWSDCPISTFHEALKEFYSIEVSYNSLLKIMRDSGIKPPRSWNTKEKKEHKSRKERKHAGELVQMDASTHDWFMNGTLVSLHGGIDDATHTVTGLYFCLNECRLGYNEVLRQTWTKFGIPQAYYIDRHSSFVSSKRKKGRTFTERLELSKNESTHFNDLCRELDIEVVLALSAQGKGRIERLWQTLQGQLPFIFRFLKISTIQAANSFIESWLGSFNKRFSIKPQDSQNLFRPLPRGFNLDYKLSLKFTCRTDSMGYFTFHDCDFRLSTPNRAFRHFELCLSEQLGLRAYMNGGWYSITLAEKYLQDLVYDTMPIVEKDLINRYLLSNLHSDYA